MKKKILAITLILSMLLTMVSSAGITINSPLNLSRSIRGYDGTVVEYLMENGDTADNSFIMDYTITPDDIDSSLIEIVYPPKEIVLVIDNSGSMNKDVNGNNSGTSRMTLTKNAAKRFIEKLKDYPNIKVSIVKYATEARTFTDGSQKLFSLNNATEYAQLTSYINGISASGGTNIGDGVRNAYNVLNSTSGAEKYMVFLSDGEPTAFSYQSMTYSTSGYAKGLYYHNGSQQGGISSFSDITYYTGLGNAPKSYVNYTSSGDVNGKSLAYSKLMTNRLKADITDIKSYFVGFSLGTSNKLSDIAGEISAYYRTASSADEIDQVYQDIAVELTADVRVQEMNFEETIPEGLVYMPVVDDGLTLEGRKLTRTFDEVVYLLNDAGTFYEAEPVTFSIKYKVNKSGNYTFDESTSKLTYEDINDALMTKTFNTVQFNAVRAEVENVVATRIPNTNTNKLTWDAYEGATGYNIYQVNGDIEVLISNNEIGTNNEIDLPILENDANTTTYAVEAILSGDEVSRKATVLADTMADIINLRTRRSNGQFILDWDKIEGASAYTVTPIINGVDQTTVTITTPTYVGGKVRVNYDVTPGVTYDNDDTIKFRVDATKPFADVDEAISEEFLIKELVTSSIVSDIDNFKYATSNDVEIKFVSSDSYPTGVMVYNPLLVVELNLPSPQSNTPFEYTYSTLDVFKNGVKLNATVVKGSGSNVKIYVELDDYSATGLPEATSIDVKTNFAIGYESEDGQMTSAMFAALQALNSDVKVYNVGNYIESLIATGYSAVNISELFEIRSYVMYNESNQVVVGTYTRDKETGVTSDHIQLKNEATILDEF